MDSINGVASEREGGSRSAHLPDAAETAESCLSNLHSEGAETACGLSEGMCDTVE